MQKKGEQSINRKYIKQYLVLGYLLINIGRLNFLFFLFAMNFYLESRCSPHCD